MYYIIIIIIVIIIILEYIWNAYNYTPKVLPVTRLKIDTACTAG